MRRNKFKNHLKGIKELKASKDPVKMIEHLLIKLNEVNCEIIVSVLKKENAYKINYNNNIHLLYDKVASKIAEQLVITNHLKIHIDKSKNQQQITNFNNTFLNNIQNKKKKKKKI